MVCVALAGLLPVATARAGAPAVAKRPAPAAPAASAAASTATSAAAVVPPDLQALEQKMLALQLTSERFSATISVAEKPNVKGPIGGFNQIFGRASSVVTPVITTSGEVSFVPEQASLTVSFLGLTSEARLIGGTLYTKDRFVARLDGGRAWVQESDKSLAQVLGEQPSAPGGSGTGSGQEFKAYAEIIGVAESVRAVGTATVDGQTVTDYKLLVPLARLEQLSNARRKLSARRRRAEERSLRKVFAPTAQVDLFVAETGLPVRTRLVIKAHHNKGELIEQSDITAIDIPVVVQAPPASETITRAQLERLLRERARARRRAAHRRAAHRRAP